MRLLLLGGPKFLGRAVIEEALARGDELTVFNRGLTSSDLYPQVERLRGDRDGDLDALRGRSWDAVVDTSGYVPRIVGQSAQLLADAAERYVFVSSISVYASFREPVTEASALAVLDDPTTEDVQSAYGGLKAVCEAAVETSFPGRALHVRAGLIVGPHDPTGRFTYWPHRVARGGEVLVPGPLDRQVQFVDVRDLAGWMLSAAAEGVGGPFNVTASHTMGDVFDVCRRVSGSDATPVAVDEAFLVEREVGQWMELPLWVHTLDPEWGAMLRTDTSRAAATGFRPRPLTDTVEATLAHAELVEGVGLTPEREAELLAAWVPRTDMPRGQTPGGAA